MVEVGSILEIICSINSFLEFFMVSVKFFRGFRIVVVERDFSSIQRFLFNNSDLGNVKELMVATEVFIEKELCSRSVFKRVNYLNL